MLTISKPLSASQAQNYHRKEFTSREQNYWSEEGEVAGEWQGKLRDRFELHGKVSEAHFERLARGQDPHTGEQLVRQRASYSYRDEGGNQIKTMEHRAGWDATFSAPKSVSLTALVGGDARVREAHREAVKVALEELERYTQARIGGNHPPETTGKVLAATFEHDTARPVEGYVAPQLHTHAVIFNLTERENGETRAIQPHSLFRSQQLATAIYQSELMYNLRQIGYEIVSGRSGAPEIRGYSQEYLDASSPRSQQIRAYLERTGHSGSEAAEIAAHATRDKKEAHSPAEVMKAHRKLARDYGSQAEVVVSRAQERECELHRSPRPDSSAKVQESVTFARDRNFEREAVVDERLLLRDALRRGMGEVTFFPVRDHLLGRIETGEFQLIRHSSWSASRQLTTARTIQEEQEVIAKMQQGRGQLGPVASDDQAIRVADQHSQMNRAQKTVVEDVLTSCDRIQGIQGFAGAGKTTTLRVIRQGLEAEGYRVTGFAPTSRAAKQLLETGVEAGTLQGFLSRSFPANQNPTEKHFYFVDESSLASTRQMRDFLARLGANDRVLLIGDIRQHQGVEAGRPFEQLQQAGMSTAKLDEIVRQKDPRLKSAVEFLAKGKTLPAIELLERSGRILEIRDSGERIRAVAREYAQEPTKTLIISPDNASRRSLNAAVRAELKAQGNLAHEDYRFSVLVQRPDMTGADRAWANHYAIGDVVRYARGSKALGIEVGSYGTIDGINPAANLLSVTFESDRKTTYDARRLVGVSVYRELVQEFSVGDRIQFTAPDKALGVANRDLAVIDAIDSDNRIRARLDSRRDQKRVIEFSPHQHRHFDHGYAVTSHSSQGLTAERVLIHADSAVHPHLLSARFGYVAVSRASHDATIFTDDPKRLSERIATQVSKTSAVELGQPMAQGQSNAV